MKIDSNKLRQELKKCFCEMGYIQKTDILKVIEKLEAEEKRMQQQKYKHSTYIEAIEAEFKKMKSDMTVVAETLEGLRGKLYFTGEETDASETE